MTPLPLSSKDNPLLKTFRLVSAGARRAPKEFVVAEGIRVLEEADTSGCEIEAVVLSEDFGSAPRENALVDRFQQRNLRVYRVNGALFRSISTVETPQGAIALVRFPECTLDSVRLPENSLTLCACGIQDPGNLGSLIRSAAAAGASLMCTTPGTVSSRNPKTIRSSAGAFFRLPIVEHANASEFRRYCEHHMIRLYRTDAQEGVIYTEADLKSPCAIVLGNEGSGLAEQEFRVFPAIRIPIAEGVESLNVASAGAVILFEARRQRRSAIRDTV